MQSWYAYMLQDDGNDPVIVVYSLTPKTLSAWRRNQVVQRFSTDSSSNPPPPSVPETSPSTSFWHTVKINISDYPKLKDDIQWRTFNRQLHSTAASHDTLDVLDPSYVPSLEDQDYFTKKQRFMYNVFSNIILTLKGKNCVRDQCDSLDAQKVYIALLDAYHDQLSTKLSATKLCQELTLMKLDDKWRESFESYLHLWTAKIQDLEGN